MNKKNVYVFVSMLILTSCSTLERYGYSNNSHHSAREREYQHEQMPTQNGTAILVKKEKVEVPNTYHVGEYHSPVSHKNRDKNWVNSQNPMGYTIEIADGTQAANVASKLQKTPKNQRKAQIKYGSGKYKGLYGTYNSYESARRSLEKLPADVREGARVKNWGSIQNNVN